MAAARAQPDAHDPEPDSARVPRDDLRVLPLRGGGGAVGIVTGRPHAGRGRQAPGPDTGPTRSKRRRPTRSSKSSTYFWGPDSLDDRGRGDPVGVLQHWPDFAIILVLLLANAGIGFWEEHQAGKAIDALKAELAIRARVKRDGSWITPPARELVPGDVIRLRLGDIVPADARLLEGDPIEVDQSALTGESLPAVRTCRSGSVLRFDHPTGEIGALVYGTGANTVLWHDGTARPGSAQPSATFSVRCSRSAPT